MIVHDKNCYLPSAHNCVYPVLLFCVQGVGDAQRAQDDIVKQHQLQKAVMQDKLQRKQQRIDKLEQQLKEIEASVEKKEKQFERQEEVKGFYVKFDKVATDYNLCGHTVKATVIHTMINTTVYILL